MAFRKRNQPLNHHAPPNDSSSPSQSSSSPHSHSRHPSSLQSSRSFSQSRPQTHPTGTTSLDALLSLPPAYTASSGPGLALGTSLLFEESGTTDYSGVLARCYAAEGVVSGDVCHVVGAGKGWVGTLPGLVVGSGGEEKRDGGRGGESGDGVGKGGRGEGVGKMKIAWRYESLGAGIGGGATAPTAARERRPPGVSNNTNIPSPGNLEPTLASATKRGSHTFDLTKRLDLPPNTQIHHHAIGPTTTPHCDQSHLQQSPPSTPSPFTPLLTSLTDHLSRTPTSKTHRLIIPSLLSPAIPYPPHASSPSHILSFLHALRALLRLHSNRLTALITLPLDLYPRSKALTRAIEHLVDGVIELAPFPHRLSVDAPVSDPSNNSGKKGVEEEPQGLIRVHKLPVLEERGMGGMGMGNDLAFVVSRRRFEMRAYSLPPEVGDSEVQRGGGGEVEGGQGRLPEKKDIEF